MACSLSMQFFFSCATPPDHGRSRRPARQFPLHTGSTLSCGTRSPAATGMISCTLSANAFGKIMGRSNNSLERRILTSPRRLLTEPSAVTAVGSDERAKDCEPLDPLGCTTYDQDQRKRLSPTPLTTAGGINYGF